MKRLSALLVGFFCVGLLPPAGLVQTAAVHAQQASTTEASLVFEVASVRPSSQAGGSMLPARAALIGGCVGKPEIDHHRLVVIDATLYQLVAWAYGADCLATHAHDLLTGGPGWIRSDKFDIQALIPEGSPNYTPQQLRDGNALKLQLMIQTLLKDHFKLALHHETKEVPVYALTVAKGGPKLEQSKGGSCVDVDDLNNEAPPPGTSFCGNRWIRSKGTNVVLQTTGTSLDEISRFLGSLVLDRPVINKTGIMGMFDTIMEFAPDGTRLAGPGAVPSDPSIFSAMQEQLGLKLDSSKSPVEILVIDHAEKPAPN